MKRLQKKFEKLEEEKNLQKERIDLLEMMLAEQKSRNRPEMVPREPVYFSVTMSGNSGIRQRSYI